MDEKDEVNAPELQIRHNADGYFYLPIKTTEDNVSTLYECPYCHDLKIITNYVPEEQQEEKPKETKHKSKKKELETTDPVEYQESLLSQQQPHQLDQQE